MLSLIHYDSLLFLIRRIHKFILISFNDLICRNIITIIIYSTFFPYVINISHILGLGEHISESHYLSTMLILVEIWLPFSVLHLFYIYLSCFQGCSGLTFYAEKNFSTSFLMIFSSADLSVSWAYLRPHQFNYLFYRTFFSKRLGGGENKIK